MPRSRTPGRRPRLVPLALATTVVGSALPAQGFSARLEPLVATPTERQVELTGVVVHPGATLGGYGVLNVELRNPDGVPHSIELVLADMSIRAYEGQRARVHRELRLEPEQSLEFEMPYPCIGAHWMLRASIDGTERVVEHLASRSSTASAPTPVLCVTGSAGWAKRVEARFGNSAWRGTLPDGPTGLVSTGGVLVRDVEALPSRWAWLSGFRLVVVDGHDPDLDEEAQTVLADYAAAGGRLVVAGPEQLRPGPLRALASTDTASVRLGFGRLHTTRRDELAGSWGARSDARYGFTSAERFVERVIPGVRVFPSSTFFLVVLGYVVAIGPLLHVLLVRKGLQSLSLVLVPGIGFVLAAGILILTVAQEGIRTIAVARSISVLDQRARTVVVEDSRTLFAGVSPSEIAFAGGAAGGYLVSSDLHEPGERAPFFDLDAGSLVLDGGWLPSRRPTTFVHVQRGLCRARLHVDLRDGRTATTEDLTLVAGTDGSAPLLIRDFDGRYHVGDADGRLRAVGAEDEHAWALAFVRERFADGLGLPSDEVDDWCERLDGLPVGSYLARVTAAPSFDGCGVDAREIDPFHLVFGRLGEGDVTR